jgi:hypothetical protein
MRKTPEEIMKEILETINPYVNQWMDSIGDEMRKDLLDTITTIWKEDAVPNLPDDCVMGCDEVKFCSIRNGNGWQCKRCAI